MKISKRVLLGIQLSVLAVLSACSMKPTTIGDKAQLDNTHHAVKSIFDKQDHLQASVTLPEVIARTLKYNLENRVRQSQVLLESGNLTLAQLEMLPAGNINANHSFRNNQEVQNLIENGQIVAGQQSFTPSKVNTYTEEIRWNILDFGLSYVKAQQQANKVLAVEEQKRKMTQQLIQEATSAYWKAWTAQEMNQDVDEYKSKVMEALTRSRALTSQAVGDSQAELDYQQVLIRSLRRVNQLQTQTVDAKVQLMELMNVDPQSEFKLATPADGFTQLPEIKVDLEKLDTLALVYRPELREASYETIIQEKGVRIAMLNMLPTINVDYGYNYTNNEFMLNRRWSGGDFNATWNVFRSLIHGPMDVKVARQSVELEKLKQAATTMAVLTQVRTAAHGYALALEDYQYAQEDAKVTQQLFDHAVSLEKANQGNEQVTIRRGIERLNANFDRQVAFSRAQEFLSRLYQSVGIDIILDADRDMPLNDLTKKIQNILIAESEGDFNATVNQRYNQIRPLLDTHAERSISLEPAVKTAQVSTQAVKAVESKPATSAPVAVASKTPEPAKPAVGNSTTSAAQAPSSSSAPAVAPKTAVTNRKA